MLRAMFCGRCGEDNPGVNRFCFECGARIFAPRAGQDAPLTDEVSARLAGLDGLPTPRIEWPDDLPREVTGSDGARLLLVPAGFFFMGSRKEKKDERPHRLVYLDSYYVDETPVTRGQYARFMSKTGLKAPPGFSRQGTGWERHPVTSVTWDEACAYAKWALRRLPTEAEWEKAARGIDGRRWPWGDDAPEDGDSERAHFGKAQASAVPVGSHPAGVSPFGALDMAGNVWEWCADLYDQYYYPRSQPRNPLCTDGDERYRVLRGGAATYSAFTMRAAYRGWNLPHMRSGAYGFRCAVDAGRYRRKGQEETRKKTDGA